MIIEKLRIGLDVDGVLADVIHTWLDLNNKIRRTILKEEISEWNFWERYRIDKYDFNMVLLILLLRSSHV